MLFVVAFVLFVVAFVLFVVALPVQGPAECSPYSNELRRPASHEPRV